ncbi:MAG: 5-carboxymethyl-2-hydroxymuconate Delta-isomerase [Gammaproteobacteria bacterium]
MPHLIIEYSANLERDLELPALITSLHETVASIDAFPLAGLRTRAARREHYRIADGHPDNSFVHLSLAIGHGRPPEVRETAGAAIFAALKTALEPVSAKRPLAISFEIRELDPVTSYKAGNIRDYLARRDTSAA